MRHAVVQQSSRPRPLVARLVVAWALAVALALHPADGAAQAGVPNGLARARQLVLVTTATWDTTAGTLRRFARSNLRGPWRATGAPVSVVVGRSGLAWDPAAAPDSATDAPRKHEGDGRSPAGVFPLAAAFGFAPRDSAPWVRLPYVALRSGTECVDDTASTHYNAVVDRAAAPRVDWASAERMREVSQYRLGVIVGYNARPVRSGRGSCIFLHVWGGPGTSTAGCTAMDEAALAAIVRWLDPARRPVLVQLPEAAYVRARGRWRLPA